MRSSLTLLAILSLTFAAGVARADGDNWVGDDGGRDCDGHDCRPKTRDACFNLVCYYDFHEEHEDVANPDHGEFHHCKAAADFSAPVTLDGGEVLSDSRHDNNPRFEVSCDGKTIYNDSSHRYTDLLGTRIQGETGPHPAITLPRGELHTGPDHFSGNHESPSTLELGFDKVRTAQGKCFVWTGNP